MPVTLSQPTYGVGLSVGVAIGVGALSLTGTAKDESSGVLAVVTHAGQVCRRYSATLTLTVGTPTLVDLSALTDESGAAYGLASIEVLKVSNKSTTAGQDVTAGGGTNGVFAAYPHAIKATARGDSTLFVASPVVVDTTHKILQLTPAGVAGATFTVLLTVVGR